MDDERLKNGGSILTEKYFEEQLERIREIRMSERKFYQKITDIYATSIDYDKTAKSTIRFFSNVQNKLHYAVSGNTAAEIIYNIWKWNCTVRKNGFCIFRLGWDASNETYSYDNGWSAEMAKLHAETKFEKYRIIQDKIYISDFDKLLEEAKRLKKDK